MAFLIFFGAFTCIYLLTPIIIWVSVKKQLVTPVNTRSSHLSVTPPFGGVGFYITIVVFISAIQHVLKESVGYNIIAATSILFMTGLKDDLIHTTAKVKLLAQVLAGAFIVSCPEFQIFPGFFSAHDLHPVLANIGALLILILIINAFNLIDGIDGLAAMIGIIICTTFAVHFYFMFDTFFFLLTITTIAILTAFLKFNIFSKRQKVFMGDCGSLIIGLLIGLCALRFLV